MARSRRSSKASKPRSSGVGQRSKIVWMSLVASMTLVGGLLVVLDRRPVRVDGQSLLALTQVSAVSSLERIFKTATPLDTNRWQSIVIHHSNSPTGSPASISADHTRRLGLKGIGHHFVIGNGRGMGDGELYVTYRWNEQVAGAHAAGKDAQRHNKHSISICLVGNGDREQFTTAQLRRLVELVSEIQDQLKIADDRVYLHSDVAQTSDPGRNFPSEEFRALLRNR